MHLMEHPTTKHIVKRRGHTEPYDEKKVYASAYAACRNTHLSEQESEKIADTVMRKVSQWVLSQEEVRSQEIFVHTTEALRELARDAAFMYETHRDLA